MARLAVAQRDELDSQDVTSGPAALVPEPGPGSPLGPGSPPRLTPLRMAPVAASSSAVRALIAAGEPVTELVGEAVAAYIAEHGLYRTAGAAAPTPGGVA
jgi:nicotinic acid mononucleotide adenylyltransferase